jgi:hypothetical protein
MRSVVNDSSAFLRALGPQPLGHPVGVRLASRFATRPPVQWCGNIDPAITPAVMISASR